MLSWKNKRDNYKIITQYSALTERKVFHFFSIIYILQKRKHFWKCLFLMWSLKKCLNFLGDLSSWKLNNWPSSAKFWSRKYKKNAWLQISAFHILQYWKYNYSRQESMRREHLKLRISARMGLHHVDQWFRKKSQGSYLNQYPKIWKL